MSRRQRSARQQAQRSRVVLAKTLRRRARARRAATVAAAAVALAGTGTAGTVAPASASAGSSPAAGLTRASLLQCDGATTPGSEPDNLTDVDGTLFFTAYDAVDGNGLWRTDGTAAGTVLLKTLSSGGGYDGYDDYDYGETSLVAVGGTLFFTEDGDDGDELWRSDGTPSGTVRVKRFAGGDGGYDEGGGLSNLTAVGDRLFFTADDGVHGDELWSSDGTKAGTALVKDIRAADGGDYYSYGPSDLTAAGDTLFFTADDGVHGEELWRSDGTKAGTVLVKNIRSGSYSSSVYGLTAVGDGVFFNARDGVHGRELWHSDGSKAGTVLVKDIQPGARSGSPSYFAPVGDEVFFAANSDDDGGDLWRSDGTAAGTVLVKNLAGDDYYGLANMVGVGDTVYFAASDETHGQELWRSDGTQAGTVLVKDIRPGAYESYPRNLTAVDGELYFTARDGHHGDELWRSDGTAAGTELVEDIADEAASARPRLLTESGGLLFFSADDGVHGTELWSSDGSAAGTELVDDINTGGLFEVAPRGTPDLDKGTLRVRVYLDGAGTIEVASAGKRWIKHTMREVGPSDSTRTSLTLEPTRAARRELRQNGELRIRARFTFTSCGGGVSSTTRRYTLKMR